MVGIPIREIVDFVGGDYRGAGDTVISSVNTLSSASPAEISFLSNAKYGPQLQHTRAGAVLVPQQVSGEDPRWIRVPDPYFAMSQVVTRWFARRPMAVGISSQAAVAKSASLGENVAVGPFAVIAEHVKIADNVVIFQGVSIEAGSEIGEGTIIYPNVVIYDGSVVGRRCVIHAGCIIGSDGYGFATNRGSTTKFLRSGSCGSRTTSRSERAQRSTAPLSVKP
jgi:UDP-3-O-[3-hydroxymyristoyl] glucosamine N-acyltransferase